MISAATKFTFTYSIGSSTITLTAYGTCPIRINRDISIQDNLDSLFYASI